MGAEANMNTAKNMTAKRRANGVSSIIVCLGHACSRCGGWVNTGLFNFGVAHSEDIYRNKISCAYCGSYMYCICKLPTGLGSHYLNEGFSHHRQYSCTIMIFFLEILRRSQFWSKITPLRRSCRREACTCTH